jgi:ABC-type oligopeptide transport system ATPase subunit
MSSLEKGISNTTKKKKKKEKKKKYQQSQNKNHARRLPIEVRGGQRLNTASCRIPVTLSQFQSTRIAIDLT